MFFKYNGHTLEINPKQELRLLIRIILYMATTIPVIQFRLFFFQIVMTNRKKLPHDVLILFCIKEFADIP